jgi:activator of 2-hydroxyglutaryl-CoA dehydratase
VANDIKSRSELDNKRTLFLEELAVDWAKAAQRNPHLPEALETELDKELDDAIAKNQSNSSIRAIYNKYYELAGTLWYNNIKNYLQQNDVIHINSDEEFEKTAKESVEKFMQLNTSRDDFLEIEKRYIDLQSAKKQEK